jgi:hypothetical protein
MVYIWARYMAVLLVQKLSIQPPGNVWRSLSSIAAPRVPRTPWTIGSAGCVRLLNEPELKFELDSDLMKMLISTDFNRQLTVVNPQLLVNFQPVLPTLDLEHDV